jgi:hypothetical protein
VNAPSFGPRRPRGAFSLALVALLAAACSDAGGRSATAPDAPAAVPANALAAVACTASVRDGTVACGDAVKPSTIRPDRVIGGQRVNVVVTSSNVSYDSVAQVFGFDVTVQNLLVQRMGSDGFTVSGVKVFFASGPTATSGTGSIDVANADGIDAFVGSLQPYFLYAGGLAPQGVTPAKRILLAVPKTVSTFSFTVYISTPIVPVIVAEMWPGGNRDIYRMGIDGNDVVKLSTSVSTDQNPTVANGRVVFSSYRNGNADLYSVSLTGGTETRLTTATTNETLPSLSPDGTTLAWVQAPSGGVTKVYRGDANAAGAVLATPGFADAIQTSPTWAPNGALAFTMANASSADIYGVAAQGDTAKLLTGSSAADVEPAYSPDGSKIAFASNRTGDTELYLYDVATHAVTRLTTRTGSDGAPTWLADGRIVFTCITGTTYHLCLVDPASPATITTLPTPYQAEHAAAVRY